MTSVTKYEIIYSLLNSLKAPEVVNSLKSTESLVRHPELDQLRQEYVDESGERDKIDRRQLLSSLKSLLEEICAKTVTAGSLQDDGFDVNRDEDGRGEDDRKDFRDTQTFQKESLCKRLSSLVTFIQQDMDQVEKVDDKRDTNRTLLNHSYDSYLNLIEKYMQEFKVPSKNDVDKRRTDFLFCSSYLSKLKTRLEEKQQFLSSCPSKEEVARKSSLVHHLQRDINSTSQDIERLNSRLKAFQSLPPDVLQEYEEAFKALKEKKWVMSMLSS